MMFSVWPDRALTFRSPRSFAAVVQIHPSSLTLREQLHYGGNVDTEQYLPFGQIASPYLLHLLYDRTRVEGCHVPVSAQLTHPTCPPKHAHLWCQERLFGYSR